MNYIEGFEKTKDLILEATGNKKEEAPIIKWVALLAIVAPMLTIFISTYHERGLSTDPITIGLIAILVVGIISFIYEKYKSSNRDKTVPIITEGLFKVIKLQSENTITVLSEAEIKSQFCECFRTKLSSSVIYEIQLTLLSLDFSSASNLKF